MGKSAWSERVTRDVLRGIARVNGAATVPAAEWVLADRARVALVADACGAEEWGVLAAQPGRVAFSDLPAVLVDRVMTVLVLLSIRERDMAATLAAINSEIS